MRSWNYAHARVGASRSGSRLACPLLPAAAGPTVNTVTTVQTGFDQTISSLDNQQRVGQNEVTTAMKLLKKCSGS